MDEIRHLIDRCSKGDRTAQRDLYNTFSKSMFNSCLRYSANYEEAEDTLQEGFIKVYENLHQFKFSGSFEGWIRKIMVNTALQKLRNKNFMHAIINIETVSINISASEDIISQIGTKELIKMIQQLPPAYRTVFNLYVFEGMKHREIAEALNISEGTSKSNLFDARSILQRSVAKSLQIATEKGQTI